MLELGTLPEQEQAKTNTSQQSKRRSMRFQVHDAKITKGNKSCALRCMSRITPQGGQEE